MTIQWYLVLLFLFIELFCFLFLVLPIPVFLKTFVFRMCNKPAIAAKLHTSFRVALFILVALFADASRTWYKINEEQIEFPDQAVSDTTSHQASLFLAQRNAVLSGTGIILLL